jgi:hypothetical protein
MWASYPTNYLPLGRNASLASRRRDKGKPAARWGRKAYGLALKQRAGSQATERRWSYFLPWRISTLDERKEWSIYERLIREARVLVPRKKGANRRRRDKHRETTRTSYDSEGEAHSDDENQLP